MKLVYTDNRQLVQVGDPVVVSGVAATVADFPKPHKPNSEGKVTLSSGATYYVSVIGAQWIDREDRDGWGSEAA